MLNINVWKFNYDKDGRPTGSVKYEIAINELDLISFLRQLKTKTEVVIE